LSDEVARLIFEEIAGIIPGTEFIDRGLKIYERFDLERIEHIRSAYGKIQNGFWIVRKLIMSLQSKC